MFFGLAQGQHALAELQEAWDNLGRSLDYYVATKDIPSAVTVAEYPIPPPLRLPGMTQRVVRALELVSAESHEAGRLLARYGHVVGVADVNYQEAEGAFGKALAIARRVGDQALELRVLTCASGVENEHLHLQASVNNALRAIELARSADDPGSEVAAHGVTARSLIGMGNLGEARLHAEAYLALADRLRIIGSRVLALVYNATLSALAGDWQSARAFHERAEAINPQHPYLSLRASLEYQAGDLAEGEAHLEQAVEVMRSRTPDATPGYTWPAARIPLVARITGGTDRFDVAQTAAEVVLTSSPAPLLASFARAGLALMAVQQENVEAASEQYAALESLRGTFLCVGLLATDHLLGLLAQTMGNLSQAAEHFEDALAFCRKEGARPELAWTRCDYADALLQRSLEGDRQKAMALLDEGLTTSREQGMRPLMERVLARRQILSA